MTMTVDTGMTSRPGSPPVNDQTVRVYRHAVSGGGLAVTDTEARRLGLTVRQVTDAARVLMDCHLLRCDPDAGGRLVPVDPEIAATLLVSPMEREIFARREAIAEVREWTDGLRRDYAQADGTTPDATPVQPVNGTPEVRGYLKTAADSCREDVLLMHSGEADNDVLDDFVEGGVRLLDRGLTVRIVCRHRSRADLVARAGIQRLLDTGAVVRTVSRVPRDAVVFDRSLAVLVGESGGEATAARVSSAEVVDFLLDVFEHVWDLAIPLQHVNAGYADVTEDLHQTILRLMAKGFTDEVLARKLGMSVRTCRRHIADLMRGLGAVSRFQAGSKATDLGLLGG